MLLHSLDGQLSMQCLAHRVLNATGQQYRVPDNDECTGVLQVIRRKFVWKVGVGWAVGFLCEAIAFAVGANAGNNLARFRLSAIMLVAAACSFHVPVVGPNFKSLYRSYMITWVALDAATQNLERSEARERPPQRRFNSSPNIAAAAAAVAAGSDGGHIALTNFLRSTRRPTNVAFAQNLGRVSPPPRNRTNSTAQQERANECFKVHLQLALVAVATSIHASLLLAPAVNVLMAAIASTDESSKSLHDNTALQVLLLGVVVAAWAVAVCVRWNVIYGVSAFCVLLSLPVEQWLLSSLIIDSDSSLRPTKETSEPLWAALSRSPGLLTAVFTIAVAHWVLWLWETFCCSSCCC